MKDERWRGYIYATRVPSSATVCGGRSTFWLYFYYFKGKACILIPAIASSSLLRLHEPQDSFYPNRLSSYKLKYLSKIRLYHQYARDKKHLRLLPPISKVITLDFFGSIALTNRLYYYHLLYVPFQLILVICGGSEFLTVEMKCSRELPTSNSNRNAMLSPLLPLSALHLALDQSLATVRCADCLNLLLVLLPLLIFEAS